MQETYVMLDELIETLESNGELSVTNGIKELFIQSVDDKEGYSYVSSTNDEFATSEEAVEWIIAKMDGIDNIESWE